MRTIAVIFSVLCTTVWAYDFPILQKTLGGLDNKEGVLISKSCQIFDNQPHIKIDEVLKLVAEAEKAPIRKFLHIQKQVPSIEVWANYPTKYPIGPAATGLRPRKVLLLEDSSTGQAREGRAAESLMELAETLCKDL